MEVCCAVGEHNHGPVPEGISVILIGDAHSDIIIVVGPVIVEILILLGGILVDAEAAAHKTDQDPVLCAQTEKPVPAASGGIQSPGRTDSVPDPGFGMIRQLAPHDRNRWHPESEDQNVMPQM